VPILDARILGGDHRKLSHTLETISGVRRRQEMLPASPGPSFVAGCQASVAIAGAFDQSVGDDFVSWT
jgi:hypothetical protein